MSETSNPVIQIDTSMGTIVLELDAANAPLTVDNFLAYVHDGHYVGTIFHRVIDGFMIQAGGMSTDFKQKPTRPPIKNEADNGLQNKRGTVAMARTQIVDSATSQFFINVDDNDFLNFRAPTSEGYGYAVFGKVIEGLNVVDAIRQVKTGKHGPHQDVPVQPIVIDSVSVRS
ncbi:MAG: peptidyl-prolyl cis-trans isomerase [Deltaproteobacteria bacterium]|jgi:cyclophilin family peptidyl-prolyl cis-trans isomerase|nr:peptidyl-prolyl cis-trans isomerase [Deltaproteobacteria bacterium]MBW2503888.1 peptidyl-prolyl cis-trans isomerase [Deltaproteobacteria bacterium]